MLNTHERNRILQRMLRPDAPQQEPFHRKAYAAVRRLDGFNLLVFAISVICLLVWLEAQK